MSGSLAAPVSRSVAWLLRIGVVTGETEPGCRVVVDDVVVEADTEGHFELRVTLTNGYNFLVVQAIDAVGNTAFSKHTVIAELTDSTMEP